MLKDYYADLHIHIGSDEEKRPVKITGSKSLTLSRILQESSRRKGLDLIGVVDCHVPAVQKEIATLLEKGQAIELEHGEIGRASCRERGERVEVKRSRKKNK